MFNLIRFRFFNRFIVSVITITTILFISQNSSAADLTELIEGLNKTDSSILSA